jgi:glutamate racemase
MLLGCTHYPLMANILEGIMGKRTKFVSSGEKLAEILVAEWNVRENNNKNSGSHEQYFVSDITPSFVTIAEKILGKRITITQQVI